jgi:hypothetical protein
MGCLGSQKFGRSHGINPHGIKLAANVHFAHVFYGGLRKLLINRSANQEVCFKLFTGLLQTAGGDTFLTRKSGARKRPTKDALDAAESARIPSSFLLLSYFLAGRFRRPRPSAGHAIRWAVAFIQEEKFLFRFV